MEAKLTLFAARKTAINPMMGIIGCCARATKGQAAVAPQPNELAFGFRFGHAAQLPPYASTQVPNTSRVPTEVRIKFCGISALAISRKRSPEQ
jgi:hypothetical protein